MSTESSLTSRFSVLSIIQVSHFLKRLYVCARYVIVNFKETSEGKQES
jgi:hypothetical protein